MTADAARARFRTLLQQVDTSNRQQTISTITSLLPWYRDLFDEELIAAWQKDSRANLPEVIRSLADARVAAGIIGFSWQQARAATFTPAFAPMLGDLMARYSASARPMVDDLLGQTPALSTSEAEVVCRILIDMPDTDVWQRNARQILPRLQQAAEKVLDEDVRGVDQEKAYRAQVWLNYLRGSSGRTPTQVGVSRSVSSQSVSGSRRLHVDGAQINPVEPDLPSPVAPDEATLVPRVEAPPPSRQPAPPSLPAAPPRQVEPAGPAAAYTGPASGTLECGAVEIPQNGEHVFSNLPPGKLQLEYDTKIWDARLTPAGNGQRLILTNKRPGSQKRCTIRWRIAP